jgi:hypothetical protein
MTSVISMASPFARVLLTGMARLRTVCDSGDFTFVINGERINSDLFEAVLLSPAVSQRLRTDWTDRLFVIGDSRIRAGSFSLLRRLLALEPTEIAEADKHSLLYLCQALENPLLAAIFLQLLGSSAAVTDFSELELSQIPAIAIRFHTYSTAELSALDAVTMDLILSNESLTVESEDLLMRTILALGKEYHSLFRHVRFEYLSRETIQEFLKQITFSDLTDEIWERITVRLDAANPASEAAVGRYGQSGFIDSATLSPFARAVQSFGWKDVVLLYRGSRDGFESEVFHERCDGKSPTVTIVRTAEGYVFGGYTPVPWAADGGNLPDPSLQTFLFSLKNPYDFPPKKFALKGDQKSFAIYCNRRYGPSFGGGFDFVLCSGCDAQSKNATNFGYSYENDTGRDGKLFLAGSPTFRVEELEVFSVAG